ncbi:MAG: 7-carboxy-7-deazaguanine synthase QueE [Gammaproteobacteria bacterium]|nr:MAG: 7-carboxy-7-deazaguanine synthase QueE [Gammaproteobacteria bacterium]
MTRPEGQLRITEIFLSLQGETNTMGLPTVFVRLTGCPLRCQYCDTAYAFSGGKLMSFDTILDTVQNKGVRYVTVTGGEPLAQPNVHMLLTTLCDEDFIVSLETSGAVDISGVDPRVVKILDIKTPGSGEVSRNLWKNIDHCDTKDQIKFVICNRQDYDWAKLKCDEHTLSKKVADVLFSPSADELCATELADWIIEDRLPVRMQIQLHKYLWGDQPGR